MLQVKNCLTQLQNCFTENTHIYPKGNKGTDELTLDGKHPGLTQLRTNIEFGDKFLTSEENKLVNFLS